MRHNWIIALLLAAVTLALYWPVRQFDLIYFDDPLLLKDSPEVQAGLTWASVKWALTSVVIANWQPVTNLSFLAVSQWFGAAPGPHHLANALLHAANAALLFLLLRRLTGSTRRSAAVAAIFAWHPLRVESVAWIAERKDVLCAFFFLLSLLCWDKSVRRDRSQLAGQRQSQWRATFHTSPFYWLALTAFGLSLMSKAMAVTLPFVLLLLDLWPLGRAAGGGWQASQAKVLLVEKIPFFVLMLVFCVATYVIQHDYAAMTPWEKLGLAPRVANAISSYLAYVMQLFWPANLAAIYPYPKTFDPSEAILKAALLLAISIGCLHQLTRRPWLAVGWFWYLGMALPVIGIVQVGEQAMADRYTYLPLIGPIIALVWTAADIFSRRRAGKIILPATAVLVLSTLVILTSRQLQLWRNTVALFEQNVAVTPENGSAYFTLGLGLLHAGETNRAIICFRVAKTLLPGDLQVRKCLASALSDQGHFPEAAAEYAAIIELEPGDTAAHMGLAGAFAAQGQEAESIAQLNEALRLNPDLIEALNNLAWVLATSPHNDVRDGNRAVRLAQRACGLTKYQKTRFIGTLAAAQAEAGMFDDAMAAAQKACDLAAKNQETELLQKNQELLERYRAHKTAQEE